jgi:callose synthase
VGRKTYDDFNEFFWTPACLRYVHHHALSDLFHSETDADQPTIAEALQEATKTYIEKRSWLHPLQTFHRIFEWHLVTFTLLATLAFHNALIWRTSFTLLVGSFVLWEINFLGIIWTCLEIWTIFPTNSLSGPAIYGFILRLLASYVVLLYQSVYYYWASCTDTPPEDSIRALGDSNFWWWQYLWISFFALSLYFIETLVCWIPKIYSLVLTCEYDTIQILLNILYPFSQLYVGKNIHTTQLDSFTYITFWIILIAFKLWFGYYYIIFPIAIPSIEIFDDYMNFPDVSFLKAAILMTIWWFPHFMVYLIDMSIWFSVLSAVVGGFRALLDRQGAVRNVTKMRNHFMKLPAAFQKNLMTSSSGKVNHSVSRDDLKGIPTHEAKAQKSSSARPLSVSSARAKSTNELSSYISENEFDSCEVTHYPIGGYQNIHENGSLDDMIWVNFGKVWNEIILKLREGDLLSNVERDILLFTHFDWLLKPIYLPLYQTAGRVERAIYDSQNAAVRYHQPDVIPSEKMHIMQQLKESFSVDLATSEAISELWELSAWLLSTLMGSEHRELKQVLNCLKEWTINDVIFEHFSMKELLKIVKSLDDIVTSLQKTVKDRKSKPIASTEEQSSQGSKPNKRSTQATGNITRSISSGFLTAFDTVSSSAPVATGDLTKKEDHIGKNTSKSNSLPPIGKMEQRKSDSKYHTTPFQSKGGITDVVRDKLREDLRNILSSIKESLRKGGNGSEISISNKAQSLIAEITLSLTKGFFWDDFYASRLIDDLSKDDKVPPALAKIHGLIKLRQTEIEPSSPEARRRLHFFVNSLYMTLPSVPSMKDSKDYTCMTPYYNEDILLTRRDLEEKKADGVSTILYLQTLYPKDWAHFLERLQLKDDQLIWSVKYLQETRMWASMRAQTLFRTVEGMMFTEAAIRLLSDLEGISIETIENLAKLKFSYVVAAQAYAKMKKDGDHKADDIDFLLARYPNLRVAYIETIRPTPTSELSYYSVLIKHDSDVDSNSPPQQVVKEVYRIKLPGNPLLGEGKPENQNHALIFSRGRYLQAIDMNQAGYFEESLKLRNLLEEFSLTGCKILGFREHIFTGSVSSIANYMALQELSFVTLGQRVLTHPLRIRQHYGHPDMFDKFFVMTEGGMSKASKGINLSEDVFAGFNSTIRGHKVEFREYVQVGKGRDVGLQQTYKFEAKLSQGNAEQAISRDMNRICTRLDFFRLMSFFYGGIGHYIANTLVMFTLVLVVYTMVVTAIFNEEGVNGRTIKPEGVLQIMLAGMGILQTLPLCATLIVEKGLSAMLYEIVYMIVSGGPLYFIFHIQTKSFYFQQTLLAGGAMYRPTGRGFGILHSSFDQNFRFFASSHIYLGIELMMALIFYGLFTASKQYLGLTWSLWLVVISFVLGPFWFNPLTFEIGTVKADYKIWRQWMSEGSGPDDQSWGTWWKGENDYLQHLSLSWKVFLVVGKCTMWGAIGVALLGKKFFHTPHEQFRFAKVVVICVAYFLAKFWFEKIGDHWVGYAPRRVIHSLISGCAIIPLVYLFCRHTQYFRYAIALYYLLASINYTLLISGFQSAAIHLYKFHDQLVGHLIFGILFLMSLLQVQWSYHPSHSHTLLSLSPLVWNSSNVALVP